MEETSEYPHLADLLKEINDRNFSIPTEVIDCNELNKILTKLNHIIRLCTILQLAEDPLQSLTENDIPRIETPFRHSAQDWQFERLGNLVIIDTPGPDEAGVSIKLEAVVSQQLANSQLILIVLDYTKLKAEAAEKIKEEVQKVIRIRGKKNLYVLVNKIDQRKNNHMNAEQVRQFVANNLKLVDAHNFERIFEISASRAFCSNDFLRQYQPDPNIKKSDVAQKLAQELWAVDCEEELEEVEVEKLQKKAKRLWENSGFSLFLDKAINTLMEQVAPRCMESALILCLVRLEGMVDSIKLRRSSIVKDTETIKQAIQELQEELGNLKTCREDLKQDVSETKKQLVKVINVNLDELERNVNTRLNQLLFQYALDSFQSFVSYFVKKIIDPKAGEFEFQNREDAEKFANSLAELAKQIIKDELDDTCETTDRETAKLIQSLDKKLKKRTTPIVERAKARLQKEFDCDFSIDTLKVIDTYMRIKNPNPDITYGFYDFFYY